MTPSHVHNEVGRSDRVCAVWRYATHARPKTARENEEHAISWDKDKRVCVLCVYCHPHLFWTPLYAFRHTLDALARVTQEEGQHSVRNSYQVFLFLKKTGNPFYMGGRRNIVMHDVSTSRSRDRNMTTRGTTYNSERVRKLNRL